MKSRFWLYPIAALTVAAGVSLTGCGAPAQAEQGPPASDIIAEPPPMPTGAPQQPTPTPVAAPAVVAPASAGVLASDSFDSSDVSQWQVIDTYPAVRLPSVWEVQNGTLAQVSDGEGNINDYATAFVTGDAAWSNYQVTAAGYSVSNDEMGVVARASDKGFYVFRFRPNNSTPTFEISRYDASTNELVKLVTGDGTGWTASTWYQLRLDVQGSTLTAFVDGKQVLQTTDSTLSAGRAGVFGYAVGGLLYDNLTVQSLGQ